MSENRQGGMEKGGANGAGGAWERVGKLEVEMWGQQEGPCETGKDK